VGIGEFNSPVTVVALVNLSNSFCLGTKQAIKSHLYDNLEISVPLKESFRAGLKGKVKLGAVKEQLLQLLAQLQKILPKSFWYNRFNRFCF
jgi:hypothetical protein